MATKEKRPTKKMEAVENHSPRNEMKSKQLGQKITRTAKPTRKEIRQEVPRRATTVVAPQAMALMNNPHIRTAAQVFAQRVLKDANNDVRAAIQRAYALALSRTPDADELDSSVAFVTAQSADYKQTGKGNAQELALTNLTQLLVSLNEFSYVE